MKQYDGRKYRPRCSHCGIYLSYEADSYTPYGCADPENPEPYDPEFLCEKHSHESYLRWLEVFKKGPTHSGNWCKSNAERKAAEECGLVWVGSNGVGELGTKNWASSHQYITKAEYDRLSALPYWGHCKKCGVERKGGYCGDDNCSESFKSKTATLQAKPLSESK